MSGSVLEKPVSLVPQDRDGGGRMLRIALVTETWYPSVDGIVTRLTCTVRELHRRGHAVMVVAPSSRTQAIGSIDRLPAGLMANEVFSVGLDQCQAAPRSHRGQGRQRLGRGREPQHV